MDKRDYYEVLGVDKSATADEIKKAFRKQAKLYHPDLHPGDADCEAKFKEINEAYEVLSDSDKKVKYDQFGFAGVDPNYGAGAGGFSGGFGGFGGGVDDILNAFFGGGMSSRRSNPNAPQRGEDLETSVTLDFMDACKGCKQSIKVSRMERCPDCNGTGAAKGTEKKTCPDCRGTGRINVTQNTPFGSFTQQTRCSRCGGQGVVVEHPCPKCSGKGRVRVTSSQNIDVPPGVYDGATMSVRGGGCHGKNGGQAGDLFIKVRVRPDPIFERRDIYDIWTELPLTYSELALGAEIEVPTIDGSRVYKVPEGTQVGTVFRMKGKGVRKGAGSERGDHYFKVTVEIPSDLSREQKAALEKFEKSLTPKNYKKRQSFFAKIKNIFQ